MAEIKLVINSCSECPFLKRDRIYTADSFERPEKWICGKNDKVICGYVDWFDKITVPDWCPAKA